MCSSPLCGFAGVGSVVVQKAMSPPLPSSAMSTFEQVGVTSESASLTSKISIHPDTASVGTSNSAASVESVAKATPEAVM